MQFGPDDLLGKVALVTGSSRGIGRAIALTLAQAGADVAVNYIHRQSDAEQVRTQIEGYGRRCVTVRADVSQASEVSQMVKSVEEGLGPVAILVNNAGIARPKRLEEISEADWDQVLEKRASRSTLSPPRGSRQR